MDTGKLEGNFRSKEAATLLQWLTLAKDARFPTF